VRRVARGGGKIKAILEPHCRVYLLKKQKRIVRPTPSLDQHQVPILCKASGAENKGNGIQIFYLKELAHQTTTEIHLLE
jgi:hypothetical protein